MITAQDLDLTALLVSEVSGPNWRFTIYQGEAWGELYDLAADPRETNNLWDSAKHKEIKAELTLQLAHMLTGQMDESPISRLLA